MPDEIQGVVIVFPGSNCDDDALMALREGLGIDARFVWHKEESLGEPDIVILPGGFSYGDYLRTGAIARFSPIMNDIIRFAREGGIVLGICNGFQVLCEAGLLPGVLLPNEALQFVCKDVHIRVENAETDFTNQCFEGEVLKIPIAHGDGNYFIDNDGLEELEKNRQIVFRYCDKNGIPDVESNPNGSIENIAGIINREGNILGMMPHPERAVDSLLKRTDGLKIFRSIVHSVKEKKNIVI